NYNYEKGYFSTIKMRWDEQDYCLVIEDRHGHFIGMEPTRVFHISVVGQEIELQIAYAGKQITVNFNKSENRG
ncbi:MAG: DUF5110 domain-containing protein, partial [Chloroflexi bacterium]|nr:DUF5110 domain-containing protein [Chloroflexota bacterium]